MNVKCSDLPWSLTLNLYAYFTFEIINVNENRIQVHFKPFYVNLTVHILPFSFSLMLAGLDWVVFERLLGNKDLNKTKPYINLL